MSGEAYGAFAPVYDLFMADVDYDAWAAYLLELLKARGLDPPLLCLDAACGTGNLTLRLAAAGLQVLGSDASCRMLEQAAAKARLLGLPLRWICQTLQAIQLHKPVDVVNCALDGVNYLTTAADLDAFFAGAYAALRPGGLLLFDVSTPHKLRCELGDRVFAEDEDAAAYIWQNAYDDDAKLCYMLLTLFVKQGDLYARQVERHVQRAWELPELTQALTRAGFAQASAYDFSTLAPAGDAASRWQFVASR